MALRLGAHMSIAGGLPRAVERAQAVDATALQVFVKSSRQWRAAALDPDDVRQFRAALGRAGLDRHTLAHATYLINLAAADRVVRERSIAGLAMEMERAGQLGIPYVVVHPGSHLGAGVEAGLARVVRCLDRLLAGRRKSSPADGVTLLLEVTAGQGTNLGHRFEQLGWLLDHAKAAERLGVCFDTCHALAAGYGLSDARPYRETFAELDRTIGIERLKAFHLNDSKTPLGSRRDRHEHIGEGEVGLDGFRRIVNDRRFRDLPMVLETPKGEDLDDDRRNLARLRSLVKRTRRQTAGNSGPPR